MHMKPLITFTFLFQVIGLERTVVQSKISIWTVKLKLHGFLTVILEVTLEVSLESLEDCEIIANLP